MLSALVGALVDFEDLFAQQFRKILLGNLQRDVVFNCFNIELADLHIEFRFFYGFLQPAIIVNQNTTVYIGIVVKIVVSTDILENVLFLSKI